MADVGRIYDFLSEISRKLKEICQNCKRTENIILQMNKIFSLLKGKVGMFIGGMKFVCLVVFLLLFFHLTNHGWIGL